MKKKTTSKASVTVKKKTKKKTSQGGNELNLFFLTFIGEYVEMTGSFSMGDQRATLKAGGFLLDMDNEFYYLGNDPNQISSVITKASVYSLEIVTRESQMSEVLRNMELPKKDEEIN